MTDGQTDMSSNANACIACATALVKMIGSETLFNHSDLQNQKIASLSL